MTDSDEDAFSDDLNAEAIDNLLQRTTLSINQNKNPNTNTGLQQPISNASEYVEFEIPKIPLSDQPTHHEINYSNLSTYIYPTNFEVRDYQFNIVQRAFYDNLLVALPTGLGKTFIASTVMLNFLRWFPRAKIIFMAPTRPLVAQQIKACCGITGIPADKVAILLDKSKKDRARIWDEKLVFFTTPQVVENDLTTGSADPKKIALLVVDEAHRAKGNYAYNNVCQFIRRFSNSFRVLALTATPASDVEGVQEIINNLQISKVQVRTERSIDIIKHMKRKIVERITVEPSDNIKECIDLIVPAILPVLTICNERGIYDITDPRKINAFQAMESSQRIIKNPTIPEGLKWSNYFLLQLLAVVGQCFRRLNIYGIRSFYHYFNEKHKEFLTKYDNKKSTNHTAANFYKHENITEVLEKSKHWIEDKNFLGHPKVEVLIEELKKFFDLQVNPNARSSKVIIFTEFRESALDIVRAIENLKTELLKPHIFIGQAKEKEKFDEVKFLNKGKKKKKIPEPEKEVTNRNAVRTSSEDAQLKGMNQKLQKQIIKDFKKEKYNVLVATSIGEEGLDIGEVDLIVCFDSTSSPIKNVQRMGRTGRKRDGKVLLLFSSNEESKFDKAMGGYEYIQQHIMNGNMIELAEQNRIIPKKYTPVVEKKFIEIPPENIELKVEDDEDEIIRIALNYMNNKQKKNATKSSKNKNKKVEKKFHMPDDVETGFRSVTTMIKKKDDNVSLAEKRRLEADETRERDLLDDIVDSDPEASQRVREIGSASKRQRIADSSSDFPTEPNGSNIENSITLDSDDEFSPPVISKRITKSADTSTENDVIHEKDPTSPRGVSGSPSTMASESGRKSLGVRRPEYRIQKPITSLIDYADKEPSPQEQKSSALTSRPQPAEVVQSSVRKGMKTLGTKRRKPPTIIDQLRLQKDKTDEELQKLLSGFDDHGEISNPHIARAQVKKSFVDPGVSNSDQGNNPDDGFNDDFNDDFDDGLDEELFHVGQKHFNVLDKSDNILHASSSENNISTVNNLSEKQQASHRIKKEPNREKSEEGDVVFKREFQENEGLLDEDEQFELYSSYFVNLKSSDKASFLDPFDCLRNGSFHSGGTVGHSTSTMRLHRGYQLLGQITSQAASTLTHKYSKAGHSVPENLLSETLSKILSTDNSP